MATDPRGIVGYWWRMVAVDDSHGHLEVPGRWQGAISFNADGRFYFDDRTNSGSAQYHLLYDGYVLRNFETSLVGLLSQPGSPADRAYGAMSKTTWPGEVRTSVHGRVLVIRRGSSTLTFERDGPAPK